MTRGKFRLSKKRDSFPPLQLTPLCSSSSYWGVSSSRFYMEPPTCGLLRPCPRAWIHVPSCCNVTLQLFQERLGDAAFLHAAPQPPVSGRLVDGPDGPEGGMTRGTIQGMSDFLARPEMGTMTCSVKMLKQVKTVVVRDSAYIINGRPGSLLCP